MIVDGVLELKDHEGNVLASELVVSLDHAKRLLEYWAEGTCGGSFQMAHGGHADCGRDLGHEGFHGHYEPYRG